MTHSEFKTECRDAIRDIGEAVRCYKEGDTLKVKQDKLLNLAGLALELSKIVARHRAELDKYRDAVET